MSPIKSGNFKTVDKSKTALQHYLWVTGPWKNTLRGKVQGRDFSAALGNPTEAAGFPVFPQPRARQLHFSDFIPKNKNS
jgi:hypothetical protein